MIQLFTDFGWAGPYIGQMHTAVHQYASAVPIVDLMHDAPSQDPRAAAYLLGALAQSMPQECCCVGVVDPGVGTDRGAVVMTTAGRFFIGPDNGLFSITARQGRDARWHRITWQPENLSASFHGRDLFAPVAAMIAARPRDGTGQRSTWTDGLAKEISGPAVDPAWPEDVDDVIYIDGFGNCVLGRRAATLSQQATITVAGDTLARAGTFGDLPEGSGFWYANSMGLVEIAVNKGSAAERYDLKQGMSVAAAMA